MFDVIEKILFLSCLFFWPVKTDPVPVIKTIYGPVQGFLYNNVSIFLGIPYSAPLSGKEKFQLPRDPLPWNGTLIADHFLPSCLQAPDQNYSSEDCLYLNIFTSDFLPDHLLPVMVLFHGGGYENGSSSDYTIENIINYFITKDVIFITFNYRLNFYGFFTLMDDTFPPNRGSWDQIQALKWIQRNIDRFGGDPSKVTLIGDEAGAMGISLLLFSDGAKGTFKRAIMHSGPLFNPHAINANKTDFLLQNQKLVKALGCEIVALNKSDTQIVNENLLDCISNASQKEIWHAWTDVINDHKWMPTLDGATGIMPNLEIGIEDHKRSNRPEGIQVILGSMKNGDRISNITDFTEALFKSTLSNLLEPYKITDRDLVIANELAQLLYIDPTENISDFDRWKKSIKNLIADHNVNAGMIRLAKLLSMEKSNDIYLYALDYPHELPYHKLFGQGSNMTNFDSDQQQIPETKKNRLELLTKMWTNFAKTGNPNKKSNIWFPFDSQNYGCLDWNNQPKMKNHCHWKCDRYWNTIIPYLSNSKIDQLKKSIIPCNDHHLCLGFSHRNLWKEAYAYRIMLCVIGFVCLCILGFSIFIIRSLKKRLRTYHLIAAVAELNFT